MEEKELNDPPHLILGIDNLKYLDCLKNKFGNIEKKNKEARKNSWKKKYIFLSTCWKFNVLRYSLNEHIEKNVID